MKSFLLSDENLNSDLQYFVGDIVKVRDDLEINEMYGSNIFEAGMEEYKGKLVTIADDDGDSYSIEEDGETHSWSEEMFSGEE
jgi:hypothetical protein